MLESGTPGVPSISLSLSEGAGRTAGSAAAPAGRLLAFRRFGWLLSHHFAPGQCLKVEMWETNPAPFFFFGSEGDGAPSTYIRFHGLSDR